MMCLCVHVIVDYIGDWRKRVHFYFKRRASLDETRIHPYKIISKSSYFAPSWKRSSMIYKSIWIIDAEVHKIQF